jgi:hypothetical protein
VELPAKVRKGEFLAPDGVRRLITLWNDNPTEVTICVGEESVTIAAGEVACVCLN